VALNLHLPAVETEGNLKIHDLEVELLATFSDSRCSLSEAIHVSSETYNQMKLELLVEMADCCCPFLEAGPGVARADRVSTGREVGM
jgi:hypothetical protein